MNAETERANRLDALERREGALLTAALGLLMACAAAVAVLSRSADGAPSPPLTWALLALVGAFAVDAAWRRRRLRRARREILCGRYERRDLLRRVGELSEFVAALGALDGARDAEELWELLPSEAIRLGAADSAEVVLRGAKGMLRIAAACPGERGRELRPEEARAWERWFAEGAAPTLYPDVNEIRRAFGPGETRTSVVAAPLGPAGRPFGALVAAREAEEAPGFDLGSLQCLGLLADAASRIAELRASERLARHEHRRLQLSMQRLSRAQAELVRSEKARAVGTLVSGVAHELNNPLSAISGYVQLLAGRPETRAGAIADWIHELGVETDRCATILRNLLTFARQAAVDERVRAPLASVVQDALALKSYDLRAAAVKLEIAVSPDLPTPGIDRSVLQHVLLHLLDNALAALGPVGERRIAVSARVCDGRAEVCVFNNGPKVPAARRDRIFEPFFTTKPAGEGVGLGLAVCRKLLSEADATIELLPDDPTSESGATFVVRLPLATQFVGSTVS
jgi:signal transduction histidine kinase